MAEMDVPFAAMLATLKGARQAVEGELQALASARFQDRDRVARLEESARTFEEQVDGLARMMASRDAPEAQLEVAEEIFDYFRQIEERIEAMIEEGQG